MVFQQLGTLICKGSIKTGLNFDGFVVSDWGSIRNDGSRICQRHKHAAEIAINAGSDMDMESSAYVDHLVALVKEEK
jgi:beta-glucosidase